MDKLFGCGTCCQTLQRLGRRHVRLQPDDVAARHHDGGQQAVIQALNAKAASMSLPTEYSYGLTGRSKEQGRSARAFLLVGRAAGVFEPA